MNISEYYSRLFDIIYVFYGDADGIEIIIEHGALSCIHGFGKKIQLRFIPIDSNETNKEYFTFLVSNQMSELNMIEQNIISLHDIVIEISNPLEFIQFLVTNTALFQLNIKTIK